MAAAMEEKSLLLQIRFTTKQAEYAIPDFPFALAANVGTEELNNLVNKVLQDDGVIKKKKQFEFLIGGEFLRGTLEELVLRHEAIKEAQVEGASKIGTEEIFDVEYIESCPPPEPKDCLMHDDWVASVDTKDKWILTGSYDHSIHIWTIKGKHKEAFTSHEGPVKCITWVSSTDTNAVFASGSHDQSILIWDWNIEENKIRCRWACKGHERSVECLRSDPTEQFLGSGAFDGALKIWSASLEDDKKSKESENDEDSSATKSRVPIMTLASHKECLSSLCWVDSHELITSSWDHTIKIWDVEMGGMKSEIAGSKAFFSISYSPLNSTLVASSADRHVRIYDPRSQEGSIVKGTFTSHSGWVSSVQWSKTNENLFLSGSHDKLLKLWDRRNPRAPLYNMTGHTDKVLCTSWENPAYFLSGSSDNTLRIFKA